MMQAAFLTAKRVIEVHDHPIPTPGHGQVRVKVGAVSICGSDIHYWHGGSIGTTKASFPMMLGHEPAGVIDAVGEGTTLQAGMRVAVEPAMPCGFCQMCKQGKSHLCLHIRFLGTPPDDGIFCQYRNMPEHCCIPLPDGMTLAEGALLEPLGVGLHAVKLAQIQPGQSIAVFGLGAVGLCTLMAAKLAGADMIYGIDPVKERRDKATELGACAVCDPREVNPSQWLTGHTAQLGVDACFEAAGEEEAFVHCCYSAARGGKVVAIGIPVGSDYKMPVHDCRRREISILNARRSNREADSCLGLVQNGRLPVKSLATHFFPLENAQEALNWAQQKKDGLIRGIICPNPDLTVI